MNEIEESSEIEETGPAEESAGEIASGDYDGMFDNDSSDSLRSDDPEGEWGGEPDAIDLSSPVDAEFEVPRSVDAEFEVPESSSGSESDLGEGSSPASSESTEDAVKAKMIHDMEIEIANLALERTAAVRRMKACKTIIKECDEQEVYAADKLRSLRYGDEYQPSLFDDDDADPGGSGDDGPRYDATSAQRDVDSAQQHADEKRAAKKSRAQKHSAMPTPPVASDGGLTIKGVFYNVSEPKWYRRLPLADIELPNVVGLSGELANRIVSACPNIGALQRWDAEEEGGLESIDGVAGGIAEKIRDYLNAALKYYLGFVKQAQN